MSHDDDIDDIEPTEEELLEAAALARALDRGTAEEPPDDALQMAALLSFSRDGGALEADRADAILEDVFAEAKVRRPEADPTPWWRWFVPIGIVGTAAAAVALLVANPVPPPAMALPAPDGALLRAQASAAGGDGAELDEAMEGYRGSVLAALEDRYR